VPEERAAAALQLQAQLHFRLGNDQQCVAAYQQLVQAHKVRGPLGLGLTRAGGRIERAERATARCPQQAAACTPAACSVQRRGCAPRRRPPLSRRPCPQPESAELQANILAAYVAGHLAGQLPAIISQLRINPRASFEVWACWSASPLAAASGCRRLPSRS
jgi:hypothetical protein